MSVLITTVPANKANNIGIFTFGNIAGATSVVWPATTSIVGLELINLSAMTSFSAPNLVSVDPTNTQAGQIFFSGSNNLATISFPLLQKVAGELGILSNAAGFTGASFPSLTTVGGDFVIGGTNFNYNNLSIPLLTSVGQLELSGVGVATFPALTHVGGAPGNGTINSSGTFTGTAVSFPALVTVTSNILLNCPNMTSLSLPVWVPTPGTQLSTFGSNSLDVTSVNLVLRRCVLNAAFTTGTIILTGAPPSGQGVSDKATLIGRGVSVTTS